MNHSKKNLSEVFILLLVFLISGITLYASLKDIPYQKYMYYQSWLEPTIMQTCGYGFISSVDAKSQLKGALESHGPLFYSHQNQAVTDFLSLKISSISCADVHLPEKTYTDIYIKPWYYLSLAIVVVWKIFGISWSAVNIVVIFFGSIAISFSYLFFRLGMSRGLACVGALLFLLVLKNPEHFLYVRDYSKIPYLIGSLFILALLVLRPQSNMKLILFMIDLGLIIGIGYGTRSDNLITLPLAIITILFFLPNGLSQWRRNIALSALLLCAFVVAILPLDPHILGGPKINTNQGHVIELGLAPVYTQELHVTPSLYENIYTYNDKLIYLIANEFKNRVENTPLYFSDYDSVTLKLYLQIVKTFPADILIRLYGAITQDFFHQYYYLNNGLIIDKIRSLGAYLTCFLILFLIGTKQYRLGIYLFLTCCYFFSYPTLQFHPRHFYYLVFWFWWPVGFCLDQALSKLNKTNRHPLMFYIVNYDYNAFIKSILIFLAGAAIIFLTPLWFARWYQTKQVEKLIQAYTNAPSKKTFYISRQKNQKLSIFLEKSFSNQPAADFFEMGKIMKTKMMRLSFTGKQCAGKNFILSLTYHSLKGNYNTGLEQEIQVIIPNKENPTSQVFFPVYYLQYHLTQPTLVIPLEFASCLTDVSELTTSDFYPLWLTIQLPSNWKTLPLYQTLNY